MKVLFIGDVVGAPGRKILQSVVTRMRTSGEVSAIVVNAENAAGGNGLTAQLADEIFGFGVDAITLGDHVWDQKDTPSYVAREKRIVRPANLPEGVPGRGWTTVQTAIGAITIVSITGRVFMNPCDCPFRTMDSLLATSIPKNSTILVDFHAEATSEKICMGWYLNGRITALVGTHTHVQTSDARILPGGGTAYITDLGMTGPRDSCIGREIKPVTQRFVTGMPARFEVAGGPMTLEGVIIDIDRTTGKAKSITAIRETEGDVD